MTTKIASVEIQATPLGRWIIVLRSSLPDTDDWGWTGSRWVRQRDGRSSVAQLRNFGSEEEARTHARENIREARDL